MAMTKEINSIPISNQPEITPIQDREETRKGAEKRSSSVGAAFKRLFSRSPAPVDVAGSSSVGTSAPSALGELTPETAPSKAGTRGRTPPKFAATPSPSKPDTPQRSSSAVTKTQQQLMEGESIIKSHRSHSSTAASHGHVASHRGLGSTGAPATATGGSHGGQHDMQSRTVITEIPTTEVIVHYQVPAGQRYLPIALGSTVTMVYLGKDNEKFVYEPVNDWLQSSEEGLRYHRTMDGLDVYEGPLDLAAFGKPVSGPLSDDKRWLVNPLSYDPTRPGSSRLQKGEIPVNNTISMASPVGSAATLGDYAAHQAAADVDLGLLAELGRAVSRGAEQVRDHHSQPVPDTAPTTPEASVIAHAGTSFAGKGTEMAVTAVCATAGAIGGAAAGELIGGDLAVNNLGTFAQPLGQSVGRNIGRIMGGAIGASAIRCPSRSVSRVRSSSQVRFSPEIQFSCDQYASSRSMPQM